MKFVPLFSDFDKRALFSSPAKDYILTLVNDKPVLGISEDANRCLNFLNTKSTSKETYNANRRELDRFVQWLWQQDKSIIKTSVDNAFQYLEFLRQPGQALISNKRVKRLLSVSGYDKFNPQWRPFFKAQLDSFDPAVSENSIRTAMSLLKAFYDHLIDIQFEQIINPFKFVARKIGNYKHNVSGKSFEHIGRECIFDAVEELIIQRPERYTKMRFLITFLIECYPRISEFCCTGKNTPTMAMFKYKTAIGKNGERVTGWVFEIKEYIAKGNKGRYIPLSQTVIDEMKAYRAYLSSEVYNLALPSMPDSNELYPIFPTQYKPMKNISPRTCRGLIKEVLDKAIEICQSRLNEITDPATIEAYRHAIDKLHNGTVHKFRHTGISIELNEKKTSIAIAQENAGHSNIATTSTYNETLDAERLKAKYY